MEIIKIQNISDEYSKCLELLFATNYKVDFRISAEIEAAYRVACLNKMLDNDISAALIAVENDRILGIIAFTLLPWDSQIFSTSIASIVWFEILPDISIDVGAKLLQQSLSEIRKLKVQCLFARIDYSRIDLLGLAEESGFRTMDIAVTLGLDSNKIITQPQIRTDITARDATRKDLLQLVDIAQKSFTYSHFHREKRFPQHLSDELFGEWVTNGVNGRSSRVLVLEKKEELLGFSLLNIDKIAKNFLHSDFGQIDLIAIKSKFQGKSYGNFLLDKSLHWLRQFTDHIEIRTQLANSPALIAYQSAGFRLLKRGIYLPAGVNFHYWF